MSGRWTPDSGRRTTWLWTAAVVVALGLGILFGRWAFGTPQVESRTDAPATVTVQTMSVGRSVPVFVSATWTEHPFGVGAAEGVLTSLPITGTANIGDVLYTVDLRPVVAAVGSVPAFRDLTQGDSGADVQQLQQFLVDIGLFEGAVDGTFTAQTTAAVQSWQQRIGVEADGIVRAADIVYTPELPTAVKLLDGIAIGTRLNAGDIVLSALDPTPEFAATILQDSPADPALPFTMEFGDQKIETVVAATRPDQGGASTWVLTRPDGSSVCADQCNQVPLDPALAVYPAHQIVIPEATGPGVPAAALWLTAAGDPYLVTPEGEEIPVTILSQGQGSVVLSGVDEGTVVVLAGSTAPTPVQSSEQP
jgi:peptidoglycan hydrolase-like protein with peptidoglycan-binding domain